MRKGDPLWKGSGEEVFCREEEKKTSPNFHAPRFRRAQASGAGARRYKRVAMLGRRGRAQRRRAEARRRTAPFPAQSAGRDGLPSFPAATLAAGLATPERRRGDWSAATPRVGIDPLSPHAHPQKIIPRRCQSGSRALRGNGETGSGAAGAREGGGGGGGAGRRRRRRKSGRVRSGAVPAGRTPKRRRRCLGVGVCALLPPARPASAMPSTARCS